MKHTTSLMALVVGHAWVTRGSRVGHAQGMLIKYSPSSAASIAASPSRVRVCVLQCRPTARPQTDHGTGPGGTWVGLSRSSRRTPSATKWLVRHTQWHTQNGTRGALRGELRGALRGAAQGRTGRPRSARSGGPAAARHIHRTKRPCLRCATEGATEGETRQRQRSARASTRLTKVRLDARCSRSGASSDAGTR